MIPHDMLGFVQFWLYESKMRRRSFMTLLGSVAAPCLHRAFAQTAQARIGFLRPAPAPENALEAFRAVLDKHGFIVGRNCELVMRWGDGDPEHLRGLAAKLVNDGVDVIVVDTLVATQAVHAVTSSTAIVMAGGADPVAAGIAKSLSRPGGNVTGITGQSADYVGKTFELLSQIVPHLSRVAVIDMQSGQNVFRAADAEAARMLGLSISYIDPHEPSDVDAALSAAVVESVQGVVVRSGPFNSVAQRHVIVEGVAKHKLPAVYLGNDFVEVGGLVSYSADKVDEYRRAADMVAKILRGAKPADLPIEQPTHFELVVNLKTASALGLTIPPSVLARADEVIE